jgi:hypothetical protein
MSAIISRESHSGSHRGSSCHFFEYGKNTLCEPCRHPHHGPFAKIGIPCMLYRYIEQLVVERKNAKKRTCRTCGRNLPIDDFPKEHGMDHGTRCRSCTRDYNAAASEKRRTKEHALFEPTCNESEAV